MTLQVRGSGAEQIGTVGEGDEYLAPTRRPGDDQAQSRRPSSRRSRCRRIDEPSGRRGRVDVQRHTEVSDGFDDALEAGTVEKGLARSGRALPRCPRPVTARSISGRGQRGESRETVQAAAQPSTSLASPCDAQDLRVHAAGLYAGQAFRADVEQAAGLPPPGCSSCCSVR
ncbi:hypothetical protein [Streptomyces niveus]|uniref:hypothetical protein n=1 Tax=Streptomyces niveus TaxID=193462 RepID=UPI00341EB99B